MKTLNFLGLLLVSASLTSGAMLSRTTIEYNHNGTTLQGLLVFEHSQNGPRPGVLICHQWKGLGPYEERRADMLARMGYVVFAADIYGKGVRADNPEDASALAAKYKDDRALLRGRVNAALEVLRQTPQTNASHLAAIGYCFGGTTVLELARSGAELRGVVSFHGGLGTPTPEDARNIKCKVIALHGADDPYVPPEEVSAFTQEMRSGGVDWQLVSYGGAVHSFTDWNAGSDHSQGAAYNQRADARSWEHMKLFFAEILH